MSNNLNKLRKSFYEFILQNKELFQILFWESDEDSDPRFYGIQFKVPEAWSTDNNRPLLETIEILFKIDFAQLRLAYDNLIVPDAESKVEYDLATAKFTFSFFEREWHNIIMHLYAFNQQEDNYNEIAKLVHKYRGAFVGEELGI
jgi:hypothetical protein